MDRFLHHHHQKERTEPLRYLRRSLYFSGCGIFPRPSNQEVSHTVQYISRRCRLFDNIALYPYLISICIRHEGFEKQGETYFNATDGDQIDTHLHAGITEHVCLRQDYFFLSMHSTAQDFVCRLINPNRVYFFFSVIC